MRYVLAVIALALVPMLLAGDMNKIAGSLSQSTENAPFRGYWSLSNVVAEVTPIPVGMIYRFVLNCDTANGDSPALVDFPAFNHWGQTGSYHISINDTGTTANDWKTDNDSSHCLIQIEMLNSLGESHVLTTIADSANDGAVGVITDFPLDGEIDLTTEQDWWERFQLRAIQSQVDSRNSDTLRLNMTISLPYSQQYMVSKHEGSWGVVK